MQKAILAYLAAMALAITSVVIVLQTPSAHADDISESIKLSIEKRKQVLDQL